MTYKYYLVSIPSAAIPVRVTLDGAGRRIAAEAPDTKTGELAWCHPEWTSLDRGPPHTVEIGEAEFQLRCLVAPKIAH